MHWTRTSVFGLPARLMLPMLLVGALTFGVMQAVEGTLLRDQERTLLDRHGDAVLDGVIGQLDSRRASWASFADLLVRQPGLAEAVAKGDRVEVLNTLTPFTSQLSWGGIRILSANGDEVVGLGVLDAAVDVDTAALWSGAATNGAISTLMVSGRGIRVTAAAPIQRDGQPVGLAVVTSVIAISDLARGYEGEVNLAVFRSGQLVDTVVRGGDLLDFLRVHDAAEIANPSQRSQLEAIHYRAVARDLAEGATIAVLVRTTGLLTETHQIAQVRLVISVLALLAVVTVLFTVTRQLGKSLGEVVAATAEVARGNYDQRVSVTSVPELASLGSAVNEMAQELQSRLGELEHRAFHDTLTGLPNRGLFMNRIGHAVRRAERSGDSIAVLFVDLDDFKVVNDTLGHDAGDTLLKGVAEALRSCTRSGDTVARLGGDEFALLLDPVQDEEFVTGVAHRILQALADPMRLNGQQVYVRCSIGMALSAGGKVPADHLVQHADMAMYKAKGEGKGRFALYAPEMSAAAWERLRVEEDLQQALRGSQLRLFYQPLVNLHSTQVIGAEVLLRWQHPTRGLLTPKAFVEVSEQTGLIVPMEEWAIVEASRQLREWQQTMPDAQDFSLNLNISARQFRNADVVDRMLRHTGSAGLDPRHLTLELAEHTAVTVTDTKPHLLPSLRECGFNLAIDDFGVAGSSLTYFKEFPINAVKLDRERQAALGRGLGALLHHRNATPETPETATQPLPQLDLNEVARPFAGGQPRALLERIQGLRKSGGSGQALQALFDAYGPASGAGQPAPGPAAMPVEEGDGRIAVRGSLYPIAREHTAVLMDLELIHPNPFVPLSRIDKEGLDRLAESIREHGFLRPLVVMPSTLGNVIGAQTYWLISGERSWQAARIMGMRTVPVRVHEVAPREALQMILVDEWHAQKLPTMDRARLCGVLHDQMGMSTEEIAERLAVPFKQVALTLRYLSLEPEIQESVNREHVSEEAALALLDVPRSDLRMELWRYAVRYKWTAARVVRAVRARLKDEQAAA